MIVNLFAVTFHARAELMMQSNCRFCKKLIDDDEKMYPCSCPPSTINACHSVCLMMHMQKSIGSESKMICKQCKTSFEFKAVDPTIIVVGFSTIPTSKV